MPFETLCAPYLFPQVWSRRMWLSWTSCVGSVSPVQMLQISEGMLNATRCLSSDNRIEPMLTQYPNGFSAFTVLARYSLTEMEFRYTQCPYRYPNLETQTESLHLCLIQMPSHQNYCIVIHSKYNKEHIKKKSNFFSCNRQVLRTPSSDEENQHFIPFTSEIQMVSFPSQSIFLLAVGKVVCCEI